MSTLLISNVRFVNEGLIQEADVYIKNGRIDTIGSDLSHKVAKLYIDGLGKYLLPGMIDTQSRLPSSYSPKSSLINESKAAVAGGITSSFYLPSAELSQSPTDLYNNYSFYYPATPENVDSVLSMEVASCCGVYVDMASTDDDARLDDEATLKRIFTNSPNIIAIHAEDAPSIFESEESYRQVYGDDIPFQFHGLIRSDNACYIAAAEALSLALSAGAKAHLFNVSSAKEIELLSRIRQQTTLITADVCSHYLAFSDADYNNKGALIKCRPSIKTDIDRAALMQGLLDNNIHSISTGNNPIPLDDKQGGYFQVSSGLPLSQHVLPSILEHYQDQIFSLEMIVNKTSHAVADRFGVIDRGYIREGYWADLVLVDHEGSFIARNEDVVSDSGWTIFNGKEFRSSVVNTFVNGALVWSDKGIVDGKLPGRCLDFGNTS